MYIIFIHGMEQICGLAIWWCVFVCVYFGEWYEYECEYKYSNEKLSILMRWVLMMMMGDGNDDNDDDVK